MSGVADIFHFKFQRDLRFFVHVRVTWRQVGVNFEVWLTNFIAATVQLYWHEYHVTSGRQRV